MMIPVRALLALSVTAFLAVASLHSQPARGSKSVRVSGRVVFPDGRNWPSATVLMAEVVPQGLTGEVRVRADPQGVFYFDAVAGKKYRIYLHSYPELSRKTVETASGTDVSTGDLIVRQCPSPAYAHFMRPQQPTGPRSVPPLTLEQIVIEPRDLPYGWWAEEPAPAVFVESPGCMSGPPSLDNRAYWQAWPTVPFYSSGVGVASFVGGNVKSIRVIWYDPKLTPDRIKQEVLRVWRGHLVDVSSSINWSEGNDWHIAAVVEHDDGSSSSLLFDNWMHLRIRDQSGKYWYSRLVSADR
jgi:hypothetical protein